MCRAFFPARGRNSAQVAVPAKKKPALKKNGLLHPSSTFVFTRIQLVLYYSQQHHRSTLSPKTSSWSEG